MSNHKIAALQLKGNVNLPDFLDEYGLISDTNEKGGVAIYSDWEDDNERAGVDAYEEDWVVVFYNFENTANTTFLVCDDPTYQSLFA